MWRYEKTEVNLITTFETAVARYQFTCESLLGPLMLSAKDYKELIYDPQNDRWKDSELEKEIRARFGGIETSMTFISLVQRLHKGLLKFASKMGLDPNNGMKVRCNAFLDGSAHFEDSLHG